MADKQSEALRLANWCDDHSSGIYRPSAEAADELRRQHFLIAELVGALGVLVTLEADGQHASEAAIEAWERAQDVYAKAKEAQ